MHSLLPKPWCISTTCLVQSSTLLHVSLQKASAARTNNWLQIYLPTKCYKKWIHCWSGLAPHASHASTASMTCLQIVIYWKRFSKEPVNILTQGPRVQQQCILPLVWNRLRGELEKTPAFFIYIQHYTDSMFDRGGSTNFCICESQAIF